uniref:hypothetical protein n=1 Tax=Thauera sp. SDU_THAU2 TaxID=3136633 RepID=UPI00311E093B
MSVAVFSIDADAADGVDADDPLCSARFAALWGDLDGSGVSGCDERAETVESNMGFLGGGGALVSISSSRTSRAGWSSRSGGDAVPQSSLLARTHQPLLKSSSLATSQTFAPVRIASARAALRPVTNSLTCVLSRAFSMASLKEGTAIARMIDITATVIIISIRVKPRALVCMFASIGKLSTAANGDCIRQRTNVQLRGASGWIACMIGRSMAARRCMECVWWKRSAG